MKGTVRVRFFAQVREIIGTEETSIDVEHADTMQSIAERLSERNHRYKSALEGPVVMARNQVLVEAHEPVCNGDELAYFPPVTGG